MLICSQLEIQNRLSRELAVRRSYLLHKAVPFRETISMKKLPSPGLIGPLFQIGQAGEADCGQVASIGENPG